MTLNDIGAIANLLSAIAVLVTLLYIAQQVRQGNLLARAQARQRMVEQSNEELYTWMNNPDLVDLLIKPEVTPKERQKLHFFMLAAMRQREWEWFQFKDGIITPDVYRAYHEVIGLHLGVPRTRRWWATVGRIGFNPEFVAEVDKLIEGRPPIRYFEDVQTFDA